MVKNNSDDLIDIELQVEEIIDENLPDLEKKYREQMRQIVTQKIDLPISTLPEMIKEQINLSPQFQRRDRWDEIRQSRFIESLFMNVPVPPIFLGEDEYSQYVVLDGRQRLTAVSKFLNNELALNQLDVWAELNGKTYNDLAKRGLDKHITRRFIPAVIILKESSAVVKYDVFDRLNTGGVKANEMEIRNAIYRGKFSDLLNELSRQTEFCQLWNIPVDKIDVENNKLYQEMVDLEIVLRFFALRNPENISMRFKDYLSDFMDVRNKKYDQDIGLEKNDRESFLNAVKNCWRIFGDKAYLKPPRKDSKPRRSVPLADAVTIALADFPCEKITEEKAEKIRNAYQELFSNDEYSKSISQGTNGKGAISTRINMTKAAIAKALE